MNSASRRDTETRRGTAPRIVLVRHGPSAHVHTAGMVDRAGMEAWRTAYDAAGVLDVSRPPDALVRLAADAAHVVASDLPRAVASAERLAPGREIGTSALLREIPLAIPRWPTRLPLRAWGMLIGLGWGYRIVRRTDATTAERARVAEAAEWLAGLAAGGSSVLAVTHGAYRRLLATHLLALGWTCTERRDGYRPWSAWSFTISMRDGH
ncbi:MAG: histidine phosphatase family protein [Longimicrobiaceae bacterium]